jgi:hypothetical protein
MQSRTPPRLKRRGCGTVAFVSDDKEPPKILAVHHRKENPAAPAHDDGVPAPALCSVESTEGKLGPLRQRDWRPQCSVARARGFRGAQRKCRAAFRTTRQDEENVRRQHSAQPGRADPFPCAKENPAALGRRCALFGLSHRAGRATSWLAM